MELQLGKYPGPKSNAERQREFRKRHPGYHRRYQWPRHAGTPRVRQLPAQQAIAPSPSPIAPEAQVAPTGC